MAIIDGLAYDNPPGWPTRSRWEDVQILLDEGITVITSLNIQYIEELADQVAQITGRKASFTVPKGWPVALAISTVLVFGWRRTEQGQSRRQGFPQFRPYLSQK